MDFEQARFNMIEQQVRPWLVNSTQVLTLLEQVKRENFIPSKYKELAFADIQVPLPCGQVMLYPKVQARMVQDLLLTGSERVLEIGTGSGYMTALLARCAASVVSLEIEKELLDFSRDNLKRAFIRNADCLNRDGAKDNEDLGLFDVIVLGGSVEQIPQNLLGLLKIGGRLMGAIGAESCEMKMTLVTRTNEQNCTKADLWDIALPPLKNFSQVEFFSF